jgi:hypothetical protein
VNPGGYLVVTALLYMFATALQMFTNASRLAGVRTQRLATGLTLFNIFGTTGRFLSLFYMPLIGRLADQASRLPDAVAAYEHDIRFIMIGATAGTLLGGALVPWATRLLERGIRSFEARGELLKAIGQLFKPRVFLSALRDFRMPRLSMLRYSPANLPRPFLFWNIIVMGFWVAGPLAAYLAGVMARDFALTAASLSGLITGVSTLTLTYIVDPTAALITDQVAHNKRPEADLKAMILYLVVSATIGTLLAQLLLTPAADIIAGAAKWLNDAHLHV